MVLVKGVICPNCHDFIYSRAHYDFRYCTCRNVFIDGGFDYLKYGAKDVNKVKRKQINIPKVTRKDLYDDWNKHINKYGLMSGKK